MKRGNNFYHELSESSIDSVDKSTESTLKVLRLYEPHVGFTREPKILSKDKAGEETRDTTERLAFLSSRSVFFTAWTAVMELRKKPIR